MYFSTTLFLLAAARVIFAKLQFLGVAIAGGDFGCQIDGSCPISSAQLPLNDDGISQMQHFVKDDGLNMLRLPISWQFLVNNKLGGDLDDGNLAKYDQLVQACLATGAHCMIDIHNFARWNGGIIGQGGPTDDQFISLWTQLAMKYAGNENVVFELMNEPHDLDIGIWAKTCQKVVTAIRNAGATKQMILLPGTDFDSAATLDTVGGGSQLLGIKNPDGTTDNLILDIHKYLDTDNSGTHDECTTNNSKAFSGLADFLRKNGRKGIISETGASQDDSCLNAFCAQNTLINQNSDVFVGLVAWGAGSFDTSYVLSLTPSKQNGQLVDNNLMSQCVIAPWVNSKETSPRDGGTSTTVVAPSTRPATTITPTTFVTATAKPSNSDEPVLTVTILSDTSLVQTASVPSSLTVLITAAGAPSDASYSIALATPTDAPSPAQTTPATTTASPKPTSGASLTQTTAFVWGCMLLPFLL
ncbi:glycoside hydrolase family 5 protein [Hypomontagnella submonticulosa]|nr:glycoside hydrolase family 5 protein [Hypomontagnella submonticulosa]